MVEILVKPETLMLCSEELESFLLDNGFFTKYKKTVNDWDKLSIALYEKSDKITKKQLEIQNVARNQMMGAVGSKAEIWGVTHKSNVSEMELYYKLTKLKIEFRNRKWKNGLTFHIEYEGEFTIYHFTYFHVPDPEARVIEKERKLWGRYLDEMDSV